MPADCGCVTALRESYGRVSLGALGRFSGACPDARSPSGCPHWLAYCPAVVLRTRVPVPVPATNTLPEGNPVTDIATEGSSGTGLTVHWVPSQCSITVRVRKIERSCPTDGPDIGIGDDGNGTQDGPLTLLKLRRRHDRPCRAIKVLHQRAFRLESVGKGADREDVVGRHGLERPAFPVEVLNLGDESERESDGVTHGPDIGWRKYGNPRHLARLDE